MPGGMRGFGPRGFLTEEEKNNMPKVTKELLTRILSYLKPYALQFAVVFVTILLSAIVGLFPSLITGKIVDEALVGKDLTLLIELPQNLVSEAVSIVTLSDDLFIFEPTRLTDWCTSVNQLSPTSYSIRGLQGLTIRGVPTHSIIGDQGEEGPREESSDGVVPYWSSHFGWGDETMVPASHSVQAAPETAERMKEILREYRG